MSDYVELPLPAYTGPLRYSSSLYGYNSSDFGPPVQRNIHAQPNMPGASLTYTPPKPPVDYRPAAMVGLIVVGLFVVANSKRFGRP